MNMYTLDENECIIAEDLADAWRVWTEDVGGGPPSDFEDGLDAMDEVPEDRVIAVWVDDAGVPCEHGTGTIVRRTAKEWSDILGRGLAFMSEC